MHSGTERYRVLERRLGSQEKHRIPSRDKLGTIE
jgi:hypothetical protein